MNFLRHILNSWLAKLVFRDPDQTPLTVNFLTGREAPGGSPVLDRSPTHQVRVRGVDGVVADVQTEAAGVHSERVPGNAAAPAGRLPALLPVPVPGHPLRAAVL